MACIMTCTDCGESGVPDTLIEGSDRLELLGWLCGLVPGALYCWYRHATRLKICSRCGGTNIIREARAGRPRGEAAHTPRTHYTEAPSALLGRRSEPRARLRLAGRGGSVLAAGLGAWAFVAVNTIEVEPDVAPPRHQYADYEAASLAQRTLQRRRECESLCAQLHAADPIRNRDCVRSCVEQVDITPQQSLARESCAGMLDPAACEIALGGGTTR